MKRATQAIIQAVVLLVLGGIVAFAFNSFSRNGIDPFKPPVKPALVNGTNEAHAEGITMITIEEARRFVGSRKVVLDARTREQYEAGHLPGAILLDCYDIGRYLDGVLPLLSPDQEIMIYCESATCDASELLARELYSLGFKRLVVYKGGFDEWLAAGMPVEKGMR
jgi:rhodanese-related sulfurtransferase